MASVYPGSLDAFSTAHHDGVGEKIQAAFINDLDDAVNKIEAELGINPSGAYPTVAAGLAAALAGGGLPFVAANNLGAAADGGAGSPTENAAILNAGFAAFASGGTIALSGGNAMGYGIQHPIIIQPGSRLLGMSSHAGSQISVQTSFPHTTINGDQTLPSSEATTFTLTVGATANFPMASGGISLAHGRGILCAGGCTIFYTGVTSGTFTGCTTNDINQTLTNGTPVSTFAVWLCEPDYASTGEGAATRLENVKLACGNVPGVSGVWSCRVQEQGGVFDVHVDSFANFGIRFESNPAMTGNDQPVNWAVENVDLIFSTTTSPATIAEANGVGVDILQYRSATHVTPVYDSLRGIRNLSVEGGRTSVTVKAGLRLNGCTGSYTDMHFESMPRGILLGDLYPNKATLIENVGIASDGFSTGGVCIGNTSGNEVELRAIYKADTNVPSRVTLLDSINSVSLADQIVDNYKIWNDGTYAINSGAPVGVAANRPAASVSNAGRQWFATDTGRLSMSDGTKWYPFVPVAGIQFIQDSVATGARDNSSASTLTATFAKTTTVGHRLMLGACHSGNQTLSSISDSRGNTWAVDKVSAGSQGVTANEASCVVTIAHQIGDTLTLTFSGASTYAAATVAEFSLGLSTSLDKTARNVGTSSAPTTGATATRTSADQLLFGVVGYNDASNETAGTNWTVLATANSGAGNRKATCVYQIVSAVGTDAATWGNSTAAWECVIATYKAPLATA